MNFQELKLMNNESASSTYENFQPEQMHNNEMQLSAPTFSPITANGLLCAVS